MKSVVFGIRFLFTGLDINGEKLASENGGSDSYLSELQTTELITYLTDNLLPTTQAIIELIDEGRGIRYTVASMTKAGDDEPILFIDGVHPAQGTNTGLWLDRKGQKTVVKTTDSRNRLNIMAALNLNDIASTVAPDYNRLSIRFLAKRYQVWPEVCHVALMTTSSFWNLHLQVNCV